MLSLGGSPKHVARFAATGLRTAIYRRVLVPIWYGLENLNAAEKGRFGDAVRWFAQRVDAAIHRFLPVPIWSAKGLFFWSLASWILTTAAAFLDFLVLEPSVHPEVGSSVVALPMFPGYVANWIFDLIIFSIALGVLKVIGDVGRSRWEVVGAVLTNFVCVTVLYVACIVTAIAGYELASHLQLPGSEEPRKDRAERLRSFLSERTAGAWNWDKAQLEYSQALSLVDAFACAVDSIGRLVGRPSDDCVMHYRVRVIEEGRVTTFDDVALPLRRNFTVAVTCATVFVPTIAFLAGIVCLMVCKALLSLSLAFSKRVERRPNNSTRSPDHSPLERVSGS